MLKYGAVNCNFKDISVFMIKRETKNRMFNFTHISFSHPWYLKNIKVIYVKIDVYMKQHIYNILKRYR